jgi:oxygen-dependent protoporphyrinogen oxidase
MTSNGKIPRIVVVGGGITGLSAAWYAQALAKQPVQVTVLEKEYRWGGVVLTDSLTGPNGENFVVDGGPESFITRKPEAWELVQALGVQDQVLGTGGETRNMYVLNQGMPAAVPLSPLKFLRSDLLSWRGKARMAVEPFIAPRMDEGDESLADFIDRRLGREAREKFIGPILAGIYNTDPETQSIMTTSPVMRQMERDFGGLFKGALGTMRRKARERRMAREHGNEIPPSFFTFRAGAGVLIDALVSRIQGDLCLGVEATGLERVGGRFQVLLDDGHPIPADAVILAGPAYTAARILDPLAPEAAGALAEIRYGNIGTLSLVYRDRDFKSDLQFNGLMIPRREKRAIDAVTWTSTKLSHRFPKGFTVLKVYFGGGSPEVATLTEEELVAVVREELHQLVGIAGEPVTYGAHTWPTGFPLADVDHLERVEAVERLLPKGIHLAGNAYRGIGVPDCIRQGRGAAARTLEDLIKSSIQESVTV